MESWTPWHIITPSAGIGVFMEDPFLNQPDNYPQGLWMICFKVRRACVIEPECFFPCQFKNPVDIFCSCAQFGPIDE